MNENELATVLRDMFPAFGITYATTAARYALDLSPFMGVTPRLIDSVRSSLGQVYGRRGVWTEADVKAITKIIEAA